MQQSELITREAALRVALAARSLPDTTLPQLIEVLQTSGPLGVRALARELGRDVKRVHEDAHKLVEIGLVEKDAAGKLLVPFAEIRADFVLRSAA